LLLGYSCVLYCCPNYCGYEYQTHTWLNDFRRMWVLVVVTYVWLQGRIVSDKAYYCFARQSRARRCSSVRSLGVHAF